MAHNALKLLSICEEIAAGTKTVAIDGGPDYIPPWNGAIKDEVFVGSEDLAVCFAGVLKAHKSEHLLEGPKHTQKVSYDSESLVNGC